MKLNRKSAELIKAIAFWIDKAVMHDSCSKYNREDWCFDMADEQVVLRNKAIKKIGRYANELQQYCSMSNRKFDMLIFKLVCSQFVNSAVFSNGENYDEILDGPFHPEFKNNWIDTLDGHQLYFMPTSEMVSMKF